MAASPRRKFLQRQLGAQLAQLTGNVKDALLVFYCQSTHCWPVWRTQAVAAYGAWTR